VVDALRRRSGQGADTTFELLVFAHIAATTNACAFVASGVTDSMECERTPPKKAECAPR